MMALQLEILASGGMRKRVPKPVAVICEIDGSGMRFASEEGVSGFATRMNNAILSLAWIEPESGDK
jgi:hypothetical protein